MQSGSVADVVRGAWGAVAERFPQYAPLLPGDASFVCLADQCSVHCCRIFSVPASEADVERMARTHRIDPADFLECENGEPIALPLAEPYLLARRDGGCAQLQPTMLCG